MSAADQNVEIKENDIYGYVGVVAYLVYVILIFVLFLINGIKLYQDFFTAERKSVSHLKTAPKLTAVYTGIAAQTQASIFFFLVADIFEGSTYGLAHTENACDSLQTAAGMFYQVGKAFMYMLFLWRLHLIYHGTQFGVSLNKIIAVCTLIVIYNVVVIVVMATVWTSSSPFTYEGLTKIPNYCDGTLEPITASLMTVQEIVVSIGFLYVFYRQLRLALSASQKCEPAVIYSGRQLFVITTVFMVFSATLVLVTAFTDLNFIVGADAVASVISLILFEPYYHASIYHVMCCCCRVCLDKFVCCDKLQISDDAQQMAQIYTNPRSPDQKTEIGAHLLTLQEAVDQRAAKENVEMEQQAKSEPVAEEVAKPTDADTAYADDGDNIDEENQ